MAQEMRRERRHRDFVQAEIRDRQRQYDRDTSRHLVARTILGWSFLLLLFFGTASIAVTFFPALCSEQPKCTVHPAVETAAKFLNALLPVISGWVGAVIAYYFVERVHDRARVERPRFADHVRSIPITSAMLTMPEIEYVEIERAEDGSIKTQLSDVLYVIRSQLRSRVPVFEWIDDRRVVGGKRYFVLRYVVHESTLYEFLVRKAGTELNALTLEDLFADPVSRARLEGSMAAIAQRATLSDAKSAMDSNPKVQDVVVTLNGRADEPFVGWLTNVSVLRRCVAGAASLDGDATE
jgi:hypothetical protein